MSTICRALHHNGLSRQKMRHYSLDILRLKEQNFGQLLHAWIWIDETGSDMRNTLRKYGYGVRGISPRDFVS